MKKRNIILIITALLNITGCQKNGVSNDEKVDLLYGEIHVLNDKNVYIEDISATKLENMKLNANCDTFLLYYYDEFCSGCQDFTPILNQVTYEKNLLVYGLDSNMLDSTHQFIKDGYSTPTLMLFKDGELAKTFNPTQYESYYASKDGLETFLSEQVVLPKAYLINENQYQEKINNNEKFIIIFSNYECSQCQEINKIFLKDYIRQTKDISFYVLLKSTVLGNIPTDEKDAYWNNFKVNNGFTDIYANGEANPFGLGTGWTPTFQSRMGNTIIDAAHPFATYDTSLNEVVRHYYVDDPYPIGTKFEDAIAYKKQTGSFYANKLKEFFESNK